jgi:hypothetical protein
VISLVGPGHKWCIDKTKNLRNKHVGTQRHRKGEGNLIEEEKVLCSTTITLFASFEAFPSIGFCLHINISEC